MDVAPGLDGSAAPMSPEAEFIAYAMAAAKRLEGKLAGDRTADQTFWAEIERIESQCEP